MPLYEHEVKAELKKLSPPDREAFLAQLGDDLAARRVEILPDPAAEAQAGMEQPGFGELYSSPGAVSETMPPEVQPGAPGTSKPFRVNRLSMGSGVSSPLEAPAAAAGATLPAVVPTTAKGAGLAALGWAGTQAIEKMSGGRVPWWASELIAWRFGRGPGTRGALKKLGEAILGKGKKEAAEQTGKSTAKEVAEEVVEQTGKTTRRRAKKAKPPSAKKTEEVESRVFTQPGGTATPDVGGMMKAAREYAKSQGLKGTPKVHTILVNGQPQGLWFKSGAQASGKMRTLLGQARKKGVELEKLGPDKYKTPDGDIVETTFVQVFGGL